MKYVREFDGLRGLMAMWVLLGHWASSLAVPSFLFRNAFYNDQAVTVFIMLSGFAIAAMIDKKHDSYGLYLQRRFLRIFPVYLLFLAASVALAPLALETWQAAPEGAMKATRVRIASDTLLYWPYHLAAHLTALHGIIPPRLLPSTDTAFLGQAWSISLEWQFYIIAPALIALMIGKWSAPRAAAALAAVLILSLASKWEASGFIGKSLHDFLFGICSYYFLKGRALKTGMWSAIPLLPAWLLIVGVCLLMSPIDGFPYVIWATTIAAVAACRENEHGAPQWICRVLLSRPLRWVGVMAYSVYLSHMLVLVIGLNMLARMNVEIGIAPAAALLAFVIAGTLAVSVVSYRLVEMPFHNFGRRLGAARVPAIA